MEHAMREVRIRTNTLLYFSFKGVQPFELGDMTRLIRSPVKNRRSGKFKNIL
jgi:hypothetical protein